MARIKGTVGVAGVSTGTAAKTILQLVAPANQRVAVGPIAVSFRGTVNTDPPVLVEVLRQTSAGTMSAATPVKRNPGDDETLQTTAQHTATSEPAAGDVLFRASVHPQAGVIIPNEFAVPGGTRLAVRCTTTTSQSADVQADFEE